MVAAPFVVWSSLMEGARAAKGTVLIIDVFRGFTTAAVAFSRGARESYTRKLVMA